MIKLEKDIEQKLRKMVEKHGGWCLKWVCPGWTGVPDRIVLLPGGRVIFVETKRPKGGKVGRTQLWWADKLSSMGFVAGFCCDEEDIADLELEIVTLLGTKNKEERNA